MKLADPYLNYSEKVLHALELAADDSSIDESDIVALMVEFSLYKDLSQLKERVEVLTALYPFLSMISEFENEESAESLEEVVQKYVSYLIQNGRANEVSALSEFVKNKDNSLAELTAKFPEIIKIMN
jgi:hypothetical protein